MKFTALIHCCVLYPALLGCASHEQEHDVQSSLDVALVNMYMIESVNQAVVRQHTVYPHHFHQRSAELNELGRRDVNVLARSYRQNAGRINIRRGKASDQLYAARVAAVLEALAERGVKSGQTVFADDLPGGDGLPSDDVILIYQGDSASQFEGWSAPEG